MEDWTILLVFVAVIAVAFSLLGAWVASQKRRDPFEGFILGFVFGPLGVLIEAMLPSAHRR
jgi:hypothetical protein